MQMARKRATSLEVAKQERTVTLAESMLEGKVRIAELKRKLTNIADTTEEKSSDAVSDAQALLNSL